MPPTQPDKDTKPVKKGKKGKDKPEFKIITATLECPIVVTFK